jgi:hypothetical protein
MQEERILKLIILIILFTVTFMILKPNIDSEYFINLGPPVITLVLVMLTIMVIFNLIGLKMNKSDDLEVDKIVEIEAYNNY